MYFAVHLPPTGNYAHVRTLATLARDAEGAGWDGFFLWDHVAFGLQAPWAADPWIALAAIALTTQRIKLGPMVTPLPRRRPAKLAREAVSLDHLSGGRLILGVGIGGGAWEWDDLGEVADLQARGRMLDEGLEVLSGLWRAEPFSYHGEYFTVHETLFLPPPLQAPRIPIWIAGNWPNRAPFRRAARWDGAFPLGKGLLFDQMLAPAEIAATGAYIRQYRSRGTPFEMAHWGITRGADPVADLARVAPYEAAGVTWWFENINPWRFGWQGDGAWPVEQMNERIRRGPPRI